METFDIKEILVPTDFSDISLNALDHAIYLAKLKNANITLIHNTESMSVNPATHYTTASTNLTAYENDIYDKAKAQLDELAVEKQQDSQIKITAIITAGWIREQILKTAEQVKADIIIMGTHGSKGFREFIIGSNTFRVVNEAKCPVLSIQPQIKTPGFNRILLPFRDKPHSREKVDYAIKLATVYDATIYVLGVDTENSETDFKKIQLEAEQIKEIIEHHNLKCKIKVESSAYLASNIIKYSKRIKAELIVIMADLDRVSISEYFMGPFSQQIVNHSPIPVLSIRPTFNPNTVDLHGYGW